MPPLQLLAERDSLTYLLGKAMLEIRNLTAQAKHMVDLQQQAELRADAYERAYHDAFNQLARHNQWECAAQCCSGPAEDTLYRLDRCHHFVCQMYVNAKARAFRSTVAVPPIAEVALRVPCPLCAGAPQTLNVFVPAIPYASDISQMGIVSLSTVGVDDLFQEVAACEELANWTDGRLLRSRAAAMLPAAPRRPSSILVSLIDEYSDQDDDDTNDNNQPLRVRLQSSSSNASAQQNADVL